MTSQTNSIWKNNETYNPSSDQVLQTAPADDFDILKREMNIIQDRKYFARLVLHQFVAVMLFISTLAILVLLRV